MIVFHLGDVDKIDVSALQILKEILQEYIDRHVIVWICHIKPSRYEVFKKAGIVSVVGEGLLPFLSLQHFVIYTHC
jgi:MFS superfamily sulfate permease-like transporter